MLNGSAYILKKYHESSYFGRSYSYFFILAFSWSVFVLNVKKFSWSCKTREFLVRNGILALPVNELIYIQTRRYLSRSKLAELDFS